MNNKNIRLMKINNSQSNNKIIKITNKSKLQYNKISVNNTNNRFFNNK